MANEVAPRTAGAVAPQGRAGMKGFETIKDRRIVGNEFPELRCQQSIRSARDAGGLPGQYRLGDYLPQPLRVVFLKAHKTRVLYEGPDKKKQPVCASMDGIVPLGDLRNPRSLECPPCEYAQWNDGPNSKRIPPPCTERIAFLGVIPVEFQPVPENGEAAIERFFWFICKGVGGYKRAVEFIREVRKARGAAHIGQIVVSLTSSEESQSGSGRGVVYYDPIFTIEEARLPIHRYENIVNAAVEDCWYIPFVNETAPPEPEDVGGSAPIDVTPTGTPAVPAADAAPWDQL